MDRTGTKSNPDSGGYAGRSEAMSQGHEPLTMDAGPPSTKGPRELVDDGPSPSPWLGDPSILLKVVLGIERARSIKDLCEELSRSLHLLVPFDVGYLRWGLPEPPEDDWGLEPNIEEYSEHLAFTSRGSLITEIENGGLSGPSERPSMNGGISEEGLFRFRTNEGEMMTLKVRSLLVVPLNHGDLRVGVLNLMSCKASALPHEVLSHLSDIWIALGRGLWSILDREALASERDRIRELLDSSDDLLVIWKNKGSVWEVDCNLRTEEFIDRNNTSPDMIEGPFFVPAGLELERAKASWDQAYDEGEASQVDLELMDREGKKRTFICGFSPLIHEGCVMGVRMTGVEMERLDSGLRALEGTTKVHRLLISVLSHDLRNPLAAIQGYTELLREKRPLTSEQDLYLERITTMVRRMNDTIRMAKLLSQIQEGKLKKEFERRDLSRMVQQSIELLYPRTQSYDIVFQRRESDFEITCHRLVEQVILNLLENAMKYSPEGSRITLDLNAEIEGVTFSVRDEGEGVPDRFKTSIFERFERGEANGGIQGVGLGLAISKGIIELHTGRIWVEDSKPKGSTFKFFLPWDPEA